MNFFKRLRNGKDAALEAPIDEEPDLAGRDGPVVLAAAPGAPAPRTETGVDATTPESNRISVEQVRGAIIAVLKTVYDPEIPVDIYELGLIYEVDVDETGDTRVVMTLTTPMCPVAETLPPEVEAKVRTVAGVTDVQLELVWEPPWDMNMMSEAARLELNL